MAVPTRGVPGSRMTVEAVLMADFTSPPPPVGDGGETQWSLALKAIFWFILLPIGLVYLVKWLLHMS